MSSALYTALWLIWLNVFILNYYRGVAPPCAVLLRNRGADIAKIFVAAILSVRFVDKNDRLMVFRLTSEGGCDIVANAHHTPP